MAEAARQRLTRDYASLRERSQAPEAAHRKTLPEVAADCACAGGFTFFCALWSIRGGIAPAGIAAVATVLLCAPEMFLRPGIPVLFAGLAGAAGLLLGGSLPQAAACAALYGIWLILRRLQRAPGLAVTTALAAALSLSFGFLLGRHTLFDGMLCLLWAASAALMTPVLFAAVGAQVRKRTLLSAEEMICIALAVMALIGGTHRIAFFGVSPALAGGFALALVCGSVGGPAVGAAGGLLMGVCLALTDWEMGNIAVTMALSGLMAGSFRKIGRAASGVAFLLGVWIATALGGALADWRMLLHVLPGCVLLPFLPRKMYERLLERVDRARHAAAVYTAREDGALRRVERRLEDCAGLFSSLAEALHGGEQAEAQSAARQMEAVADAFVQLGQEAGGTYEVDEASTQMLREMLDREGFKADAQIVKTGEGLEAYVRFEACSGDGDCARRLCAMAGSCAGRKMRLRGVCAPGEGPCSLTFEQTPSFDAISGIACRPAHAPSGDSHAFRALPGGRLMMAIADGMGTGAAAAGESDRALTLLEQFLQARIDPLTALAMINDILLLRSGEEMYTTLDLCLIDTRAGRADFYKIGASNSYIKRGQDVMTVLSGALPMGILGGVTPAHRQIYLRDGDVIVMASDGVCDASRDENWMPGQLRRVDPRNPQATAEMLEAAASHEAGDQADDRTVLCARIFQRVG